MKRTRFENVLSALGAIGFMLMAYRAMTGTKPGTFPGELRCAPECCETSP